MEAEMNRSSIDQLARGIVPVDDARRQQARAYLDTLTKPIGSLGRLEDLAAQVVAIRQDRFADPLRKAVYVFAADHGVTEEGVSAYPREVTHQMVLNFLREGAAINVLARLHGASLHVVDVGVDADLEQAPGLLHHKIRRGTRNMLREAAMSEEEVAEALVIGAKLGDDAVAGGFGLIAVGEMGIGNTTAASAITSAITGASAAHVTGRGAGLNSEAHTRKVLIVEKIVERHCGHSPSITATEILRTMGGLEIAAMAGMVLSAARNRMVVVADGFISTAAAALASAIEPNVLGYLIAGHCSEEPGHRLLLEHLKLTPVLNLGMRLGEGTGAVLAMPILESAICLYKGMATFASAGVSEAS